MPLIKPPDCRLVNAIAHTHPDISALGIGVVQRKHLYKLQDFVIGIMVTVR